MTDPVELDAAAEGLAEIIGQEGCGVDVGRLAGLLEELPSAVVDDLLSASDPGGLMDTLDDLDPDLVEW